LLFVVTIKAFVVHHEHIHHIRQAFLRHISKRVVDPSVELLVVDSDSDRISRQLQHPNDICLSRVLIVIVKRINHHHEAMDSNGYNGLVIAGWVCHAQGLIEA